MSLGMGGGEALADSAYREPLSRLRHRRLAMSAKYTVLAAIDLEVGSARVLDAALALASQHPGGELHVLAVSEPIVTAMATPIAPPPVELLGVDMKRVVTACEERHAEFRKEHPTQRAPHMEVHTAVGVPADEIVWLAAHLDADLIVIGTHGRRGLKRILLGSVAEKVVRLSGCPVHVVRDKTHNATWKVPEIEPVCDACAKIRAETGGARLWCERHSVTHVRAHVYHSGGGGGPRATESSTGT